MFHSYFNLHVDSLSSHQCSSGILVQIMSSLKFGAYVILLIIIKMKKKIMSLVVFIIFSYGLI